MKNTLKKQQPPRYLQISNCAVKYVWISAYMLSSNTRRSKLNSDTDTVSLLFWKLQNYN